MFKGGASAVLGELCHLRRESETERPRARHGHKVCRPLARPTLNYNTYCYNYIVRWRTQKLDGLLEYFDAQVPCAQWDP